MAGHKKAKDKNVVNPVTEVKPGDCDTKHPLYTRKMFSRRSVRDAVEGSDAVKRAQEVYLPMPSGMNEDDRSPNISRNPTSPSSMGTMTPGATASSEPAGALDPAYQVRNAPYWHNNPAYRSYLQRARFPEITSLALKGLVGTSVRILPEIKLPAKLKYLEEMATNDGKSLMELYANTVSQLLQAGNEILVVDIDPEINQAYIASYSAESSINWKQTARTKKTVLSVFETKENDPLSTDKFDTSDRVTACLVYELDVSGDVVQSLFIDGKLHNSDFPNLQGTFFDAIPVVYAGAVKNEPMPQTPPLLGVSEISYSIYRKDADLSQAQYMTCNPNLVISGEDNDSGTPSVVGSTVALILENPESKAYYTETDTSALDHVQKAIVILFEEAMMQGASLSGPAKKGVEKIETVNARQNNQGATLVSIVKNAAKAIENAIKIIAQISGANPDQVSVTPSLEFAEKSLSPEMINALIKAWMASGISLETLLRNFRDAGILDESEELSEEMIRIANEGPTDNDDDDTDEEVNKGVERKKQRKEKRQKEEEDRKKKKLEAENE